MYSNSNEEKGINLYNLLALFFLYINISIFFALIYCFLDIYKLGYLVDHFATPNHQGQSIDLVTRSLYFSVITLLSVGYGDISPFGWARGFAMLEALTGYVLPAAFVFNYFKVIFKE